MRQITLRDIPEEIEAVVRSEAAERGVSLNKAFLSLLKRGFQQAARTPEIRKARTRDSFSRFCGLWSTEEAGEFDDALDEQRRIDGEVWQ